jgi:hypothetical protein
MVQRVTTVAFEGIEARAVDVQVQVVPGLPAFIMAWIIKMARCDLWDMGALAKDSRVSKAGCLVAASKTRLPRPCIVRVQGRNGWTT